MLVQARSRCFREELTVKTLAEPISSKSMLPSSFLQSLSLAFVGRNHLPTSSTLGTVADRAQRRMSGLMAFIRATTTSRTEPRFSRRRWTSSMRRRVCQEILFKSATTSRTDPRGGRTTLSRSLLSFELLFLQYGKSFSSCLSERGLKVG